MPSVFKLCIAIIGVFSSIVSALPQLDEDSKICQFNGTLGPNLMVAVVKVPDGRTEINAWVYGYNWCSRSNSISKSMNFCSDNGVDRTAEFLHVPFTDKFGTMNWDCYGNIDVRFIGCEEGSNRHVDYSNVEAIVKAKDGSGEYKYQCVDDREFHACVYNGQLSPPSEASYTAFMSCGIMAEP